MDILKENNKPLDAVDGFLLQVGECMRQVPPANRLSLQIDVLSLINNRIRELNSEE